MSLFIRLFQIPLASFNSLKPYTLDELEKADKKLALISKVNKAAALFMIMVLIVMGYNVAKLVLGVYFNYEVNDLTNNLVLIFIAVNSCYLASKKSDPLIDNLLASRFGFKAEETPELSFFVPMRIEIQNKAVVELSTTEYELFNRYISRLEIPRTLSRFELEHIKKAAAHD